MNTPRCQACGGAGPTRSIPITAPMNDYRGNPLPTFSTQFLCRDCATSVSKATHAAKKARTPAAFEPSRLYVSDLGTVRCGAHLHGERPKRWSDLGAAPEARGMHCDRCEVMP